MKGISMLLTNFIDEGVAVLQVQATSFEPLNLTDPLSAFSI